MAVYICHLGNRGLCVLSNPNTVFISLYVFIITPSISHETPKTTPRIILLKDDSKCKEIFSGAML